MLDKNRGASAKSVAARETHATLIKNKGHLFVEAARESLKNWDAMEVCATGIDKMNELEVG